MFFRNVYISMACRKYVIFVHEFWDLFFYHMWLDIVRIEILVYRLLQQTLFLWENRFWYLKNI